MANLDVLSIQEVRLVGSNSNSHLEYNFYCTDKKEQGRHGIIIPKSSYIIIDNILHQADRLMAADILVHDRKKVVSPNLFDLFLDYT